jgi:hypothetical protein
MGSNGQAKVFSAPSQQKLIVNSTFGESGYNSPYTAPPSSYSSLKNAYAAMPATVSNVNNKSRMTIMRAYPQ